MNVKIHPQSAMVRILVRVIGLPKENKFNQKQDIEIVKSEIFPMSFTFSEDFEMSPYILILDCLKKEPKKIMEELPTTDPGLYEVVGEFTGKCSIYNGEVVNSLWTLNDVKAYQLSEDEELKALKCG